MLEAFKTWLELNYNSTNTINSYYVHIRRLLNFTNNIFNQETLNSYLKEIKPLLSDASYNKVLMCVKVFQKFTKTNYELPKVQTINEKLQTYITEEKLNEISKYTSLLFINYNQIDMFLKFMFYTGVRRTEAISIEKNDINWKEKYILLKNTKGNKDRIIPFDFLEKIGVEKFKQFVESNSSNRVFNLSKQQVARIFEKIKRELDVKDFHPHVMRGSCIKYWRQNGYDIEELRFLVGHNDLDTTQLYNKTDAQSLLDKCKKLREQRGVKI